VFVAFSPSPGFAGRFKKVDREGGQRKPGGESALTSPLLGDVVNELSEAVKVARRDYEKSLKPVREAAEKRGDMDEVIRVKAALAGKGGQSFTSSAAKKAQEGYEAAVRSALARGLTPVKKAMAEAYGGDDEALVSALGALAERLETVAKQKSYVQKTGKLSATMQRLETTLVAKKGSEITIEAAGKWRPGGWTNRKGKTRNPEFGDADTYNVSIFIGGKQAGTGGKKWEVIAPRDGVLAFQMAGHNSRKGSASGSLTLRITVRAPEVLAEMDALATAIVDAAGAGEGSKKERAEKASEVAKAATSKKRKSSSGERITSTTSSTPAAEGVLRPTDLRNCQAFCLRLDTSRHKKGGHEAWLWERLPKTTRNVVLDVALMEKGEDVSQRKRVVILDSLNDVIQDEGKAGEKRIRRLLKLQKGARKQR
jgi:hypothetical protein